LIRVGSVSYCETKEGPFPSQSTGKKKKVTGPKIPPIRAIAVGERSRVGSEKNNYRLRSKEGGAAREQSKISDWKSITRKSGGDTSIFARGDDLP